MLPGLLILPMHEGIAGLPSALAGRYFVTFTFYSVVSHEARANNCLYHGNFCVIPTYR